ncbi:MAG TPA: hypothetical protein VD905_17445 [Flavobacteriales bacterium]|nr:hypothetical protein [Flavobacteriales bacterium]
MVKKCFIFLVFCTLVCPVRAQVEMTYFTVVQLESKVQLKWELAAGNTCNGIQVYRSQNGTDFSFIGEIDGICGSSSVPQQFIFDDVSPFPFQVNYYKLILGSGQHSPVISIDFSYVQSGYFFIENPLRPTSELYLKQGEKFILRFYAPDGKLVGSFIPAGERVALYEMLPHLPKGILLLNIEAENGNQATYRLLNP